MQRSFDLIYAEFRQSVRSCLACSIRKEAIAPVPPLLIGDRADVWCIFRNPGKLENETGIPVHPDAPVGVIGREMIRELGIETNFLISNAVFCYTTDDRQPKPDEVSKCIQVHKKNEFEIVQDCKLILAFGKEASSLFLRFKNFSNEVVYRFFEVKILGNSKIVGVIYHPGYFRRKPREYESAKESTIPRMRETIEGIFHGSSQSKETVDF